MLPLLKHGEVLCSIHRMSVAPIAITGMGCICAAGRSLPDSMEAILRGGRSPAPPVRFASGHPVRYPVFEAAEFEEPPDLPRTGAFALHAAREAVADAGLDRRTLGALRVGVCVGTTVGTVVSDKMQKTVTVSMVRRFAHGFYGKQITRTKTVAAHDDHGAKTGDTVRIVETRPLSKRKRWRVVEIIEKAK